MLLEVSGLRHAYGDRVAVADVSLAVGRGEVFGLLGPNGAGKTTTIHCISGLLEPQGGELRFDGVEFRPATHAADRSRLGVVPQELALYDELTGVENLRFFGGMAGLSGERLEEAVDRAVTLTGLAERAHDRVGRYSGGMKRRLNLAVGDLHRPLLLLLDEPTVGVDPQSRHHIFESLRQIAAEGRALLYTTHYMEEAQRLCDRIAILHEGKVLAVGTAAQLAERAGVPGADLEQVFLELTGRSLRDEP